MAAIVVVISMGVLTYKGATAEEALGTELVALVPEWAEQQGFADNEVAVQGATLYRRVRLCRVPHLSRRRLDQPRRAGPERGRGGRPRDRVLQGLRREPGEFGNEVMPAFGEEFGGSMDDEQLTAIATFLDASKGVDE